MIIDQLDIEGVFACEAENNPPICPHGHRPEAVQVALQRVEAVPREIERLRRSGRIENRKNSFDSVQQIGAYAASVATLVQALQASVLEAPNDKRSV